MTDLSHHGESSAKCNVMRCDFAYINSLVKGRLYHFRCSCLKNTRCGDGVRCGHMICCCVPFIHKRFEKLLPFVISCFDFDLVEFFDMPKKTKSTHFFNPY